MLPAPICAERRICRCSLAWRLSPPARRSWLTSSGVASESGPVPKDRFSSFRGPSWTNPLSRRLRPEGHRVSRKKEWLFRRLFRLVRLGTEVPPHRLPVEIGPSVPSSPYCRCRPSGEAGTSVPITHSLCASPRVAQSGICSPKPVDNGDIGHKLRARSESARLPFCSAAPTSPLCPNPPPSRPSLPICRASTPLSARRC